MRWRAFRLTDAPALLGRASLASSATSLLLAVEALAATLTRPPALPGLRIDPAATPDR